VNALATAFETVMPIINQSVIIATPQPYPYLIGPSQFVVALAVSHSCKSFLVIEMCQGIPKIWRKIDIFS
jgi:hypothetical protein